MLDNFDKDLKRGRAAEHLVCEVFSSLDDTHTFKEVGAERLFYYKGDIIATNKAGKPTYIEVKADSRIADTGNVLCEEEVYFKKQDYYSRGNMDSNCDIYVVVSEEQRKIYVMDFKCLRDNYRKGRYAEIEHKQQITYCYLLSLSELKKLGGLISVVNY